MSKTTPEHRTFWTPGEPDKVYRSEWFIAKLKDGTRAVLRALPEEYSHDYKTADDTYYKKDWIVAWAQFPDSDYKTPMDDLHDEMLEALKELRDNCEASTAESGVTPERIEYRNGLLNRANALILRAERK